MVYARFTGPVHMFFPHLPNAHGASLEADPGEIYALDHMPDSVWFEEVTDQDLSGFQEKAALPSAPEADPEPAPLPASPYSWPGPRPMPVSA